MIKSPQMKPRLYSIHKRKSKVNLSQFAKAGKAKLTSLLLKNLPHTPVVKNLKDLAAKIKQARKKKKEIIFMYGAHIIKCGLSPLVIDLVKKGFITSLATNGAGIIHDFEIALCGKTSEDVASNLKKGMFGMARETGAFINKAASLAFKRDIGLGESLGRLIDEEKLKYRNHSICFEAFRKKIPFCVFVGIGTDIVHQHPDANGAFIGFSSFRDFRIFREVVSGLEAGVVINFGSAVILPEVFLKALNLSRNLGFKVRNFTAANFDMHAMYRAYENVVNRPTQGKGHYFIGYHEIMLPLLYQMLLNQI
ncbi:MAG: deoxyhypusine synthase family protein [Candidatus Omnitrophica bacterium]|nr:deoxyhypusine synthase family protein [Candidatus Omnitrophota bacterium]